MNKFIMACSVAAVMAVIGVLPLQAEDPPVPELEPSKVTGGSRFLDIGADYQAGSGEQYKFSVNIGPARSPQAVVHVDGPGLRDFWGGPLALCEDYSANGFAWVDMAKPGQQFLFKKQHPLSGVEVWVWIYAHDNVTPGNNKANPPEHPDWFGVFIEPVGGDGWPSPYGIPDDFFTAMGVLIQGNIMDHRK
ncbi:MAG: hypothetical protein KJ072_17850 [Verrucomicrobia bacterium]|nr:hypothetical protein [Verrucomicrobiota bacterium]